VAVGGIFFFSIQQHFTPLNLSGSSELINAINVASGTLFFCFQMGIEAATILQII